MDFKSWQFSFFLSQEYIFSDMQQFYSVRFGSSTEHFWIVTTQELAENKPLIIYVLM